MLRLCLLVFVLLPLLSSCGLASRFFTTNECEGDNCKAPVLLDNSKVDKKWFCYGNEAGEQWDCQNEKDPNRAMGIAPKATAPKAIAPKTIDPTPVKPQPVAAIPAPVINAERAPELPKARQPVTGALDSQLMDLPADHYAVQLIALRDLEGVIEYASLNGIQAPKFVKTRSDDVNWYVLILGTYSNWEQAQAAKAEWETAKVLRVRPWIRQLGPLQEAILAAQG